jgi:TnpA family transposase
MGSDSLRAACADVLNVYSKCELPTVWGSSDKVAADGCLIPTWDDNIQTSYHIRYGKTGGVAYRHVGTNYIAYFTHFILAGVYEGTYLFDALFNHRQSRPRGSTPIRTDSRLPCLGLHTCSALS